VYAATNVTGTRGCGWLKISVFCVLTLLFSGVFWRLDHLASKQLNLILMTGLMWSPGFAAIVTSRLFGRSLKDIGWSWTSSRYAKWGYCLPLLISAPVYLVTWVSGLGGFYNVGFLRNAAATYGLSQLPNWRRRDELPAVRVAFAANPQPRITLPDIL
jgi:uncharacterized protein